ncbi:MAG: substrate-binding domain-containing protein [Treponema sp.]|nr:substrate-binding domain-containing protein [Treponema sp.]MCL2237559.1 substrate-binding domain-containing protein [Treponema sp.]
MKKIALSLSIALLVAIMVGCGGGGGSVSIGIAKPELNFTDPYWANAANKLMDKAADHGHSISMDNLKYGIEEIKDLLNARINTLIVSNIDDGIGEVISDLQKRKVIVIGYEQVSSQAEYDYFVAFNYFSAGMKQAEGILNGIEIGIGGPKTIAFFTDQSARSSLIFKGAMFLLTPYIDQGSIRVIGGSQNVIESADSRAAMRALLSDAARNVTLDAVYVTTDEMARGVIDACKSEARYNNKLPVVVGIGADFASAMSIRNNEQYGTILLNPGRLAEVAITIAEQAARKQEISIDNMSPSTLNPSESGYAGRGTPPIFLVEPSLIRNDNLNDLVEAEIYAQHDSVNLVN